MGCYFFRPNSSKISIDMKSLDFFPFLSGLAFGYLGVLGFRGFILDGSAAESYAAEKPLWRVSFFGLALLTFLFGLCALMIYGLHWHLTVGGAEFVLVGSRGLRRLPSGTYSSWALCVLLVGAMLLFGGVGLALLVAGLRGIRRRLL
jgi:hypothetical protein